MQIQNTNNKNLPQLMKELLNQAIRDASDMHIDEVEGEHYFSRNRILTRETMLRCLIAMQGGSINKELYDM